MSGLSSEARAGSYPGGVGVPCQRVAHGLLSLDSSTRVSCQLVSAVMVRDEFSGWTSGPVVK